MAQPCHQPHHQLSAPGLVAGTWSPLVMPLVANHDDGWRPGGGVSVYGHQDGGHRTWDMLGPGAGAGVAGRGAVNHEHVCSWNLKLGDSGGQQPGRSTA